MNSDPFTIADAGRAMAGGALTSRELTERCLAEIDTRNASLNAFITVTADEARQQADAADRARAAGLMCGPLHGVPISLKDLIDVRGVPTTAASEVRAGHRARLDATVTARLRQAGAVLVGKTNLHEFAFGTTNEDSAYGPARHPLDPARSPGGSSGGSAVSVTTGMALASIGTDTGGSIRIPAAACGLVGLKPSYGEIPLEGIVPLSPSLDHAGPLCRSVEDAGLVYDVLRGVAPAPIRAARADTVRLGVLREYFMARVDAEVASCFEATLARATAAGIHVGDARVAHTEYIAAIYLHVSLPEAAAWHADTLERAPERYTRNVRLRLEAGRYLLAEDYVRGQHGRQVLTSAVDRALQQCDALVLPALAIPAPIIGASTVKIGDSDEPVRNLMLRLTQLFNVTGHPAIALPCGTTRSGLPVGFQLVGRRGGTVALLGVARAIESCLPRSPGAVTPPPVAS